MSEEEILEHVWTVGCQPRGLDRHNFAVIIEREGHENHVVVETGVNSRLASHIMVLHNATLEKRRP